MDKESLNRKTNNSAPLLINAESESFLSEHSLDLEWSNLNVRVIDAKTEKSKTILKDSSGYVKHGQMLSIMGPSGKYLTNIIKIL